MELIAWLIGAIVEQFTKLPGPLQGVLLALFALAIAYRQGWNDRVRAVHQADVDKADATKQAGMR